MILNEAPASSLCLVVLFSLPPFQQCIQEAIKGDGVRELCGVTVIGIPMLVRLGAGQI